MDPFTAERHIVLALYCIAMALFVALFLLAALAADYVDEVKNGNAVTRNGGRNKQAGRRNRTYRMKTRGTIIVIRRLDEQR